MLQLEGNRAQQVTSPVTAASSDANPVQSAVFESSAVTADILIINQNQQPPAVSRKGDGVSVSIAIVGSL